jgi:hypothetical protein
MVDAYKLFDLNEIKPDQQHFEELFNYFALLNGAANAYEIQPLDLPSPTLSEDTLVKVATEEELRIMLGLPAQKPVVEVQEVKAEKDKFEWSKDIEVFAEYGESAEDYIEISSRAVQIFEEVELFELTLEADELELLDEGRQKFEDIEANTPEENKVLEYVKKNPISTKADIARATDLTEGEVETIINTLKRNSVLSLVEGAWSINTKRPSKALVDRIADEIKSLEVKYKYTGPKDSKNREFCAALLDLNKLYTRKEIDTISKRVGFNVWTKRGGWQTVKGTDIHLPFCRHTWNSILTQKKKR